MSDWMDEFEKELNERIEKSKEEEQKLKDAHTRIQSLLSQTSNEVYEKISQEYLTVNGRFLKSGNNISISGSPSSSERSAFEVRLSDYLFDIAHDSRNEVINCVLKSRQKGSPVESFAIKSDGLDIYINDAPTSVDAICQRIFKELIINYHSTKEDKSSQPHKENQNIRPAGLNRFNRR